MRKIVLLFILIISTLSGVVAQSFYRKGIDRKLVITGSLGLSSYLGELTNPGDYIDSKLNFGTGLEYYAYGRFSLRTNLQWFRIGASDFDADPNRLDRGIRNLSFRSDNFEWMVGGAIYLFSNDDTFTKRKIINPYVFAGIGLIFYNPKTELNGQVYSLRPLMTEGIAYKKFATCYPIGGGLRIKLASFLDLSLEAGMRMTNTDYLDDISNDYLGQDEYSSEQSRLLGDRRWEVPYELAGKGDDRGNPEFNDAYLIMSAKLSYYVPSIPIFGNIGGGSKFNLKHKSMKTRGGKYKYKTSKGGKLRIRK